MTNAEPLRQWLLRPAAPSPDSPDRRGRPAAQPSPEASPEADEESLPDARSARVLVVDDDPGARRLAAITLEEGGFTVATAADGAEALAAIAGTRPDVVLLDLEMPVMDGREFLARLRETDPDLPVVIVTGRSAMQARLELSAQDAIQKPYDPLLLVNRVARAVAASRAR
jgi:CheY-like chemotaxis protein